MYCATTVAAADVAHLADEPSAPSPDPSGDEEEIVYRTVVEPSPQGELDDQRALDRDTPGFGTAVDLTDRGATPDDDLASLLARSPGVHVRSLGGLGQFSSLSLRGSTAQQVGVFTDGVPLGSSFDGLINLADLPLRAATGAEIFRGYVPVRYGGATLGGAVDVHGDPGDIDSSRVSMTTGLGSFGGRSLAVDGSFALAPRWVLSTHVGYAGARGDFHYRDDASTPTFTGDDRTLRRTNNDYDRLLASARLDVERGRVRAHLQQWFVGRDSGIAGPIGVPASSARLGTIGVRTTGGVERSAGRPGGRLSAVFGLGVRGQRFEDPRAELGPGVNDQRVRSVDLYLSPRWRTPLWPQAFASITADVRPEWVRVDERAAVGLADPDSTASRFGAGVGAQLEQFLFERRVRLVPAIRVDALSSTFEPRAEGASERREAEVGASPRMGARVRVVGPLEVRGSVGRYFRPPTLVELFGDQGYVVGNDALSSERGTAVDGGVVLDHEGDRLQAYGQAAGFASWSEDLITWVSIGRVSRAVNLDAAAVRGAEATLTLRLDQRLQLDASYTFTDAVDRSDDPITADQPLPGRPRHDATVHASLGRAWTLRGALLEPRLSTGAEVLAGTRLDTAGRFEVPARLLHSVGLQLHVNRRIHWALEVRNLLDQRTGPVTIPVGVARPTSVAIGDFLGYPLPGRAVWTSLGLDFDVP